MWPHTLHPAVPLIALQRLLKSRVRLPPLFPERVNTFAAQASFESRMRPAVERLGFVFLDTYSATYDAAFPASDAAIGVRFDRNSAFHYLDAGRYLMTALLTHVFDLLAR